MALTPKLLQQGSAGGGPKNYIEDVFSTFLYTGNNTSRAFVNDIDLSTYGGMVWRKARAGTYSTDDHILIDTARGRTQSLFPNGASAQIASASREITSFNTNGFSVPSGDTNGYPLNTPGTTYVSWTFRKQPKFFDIVTYTGDGNYSTDTPSPYGRAISHSLGSRPGFIIIKATSAATDWYVGARKNDTYWIGSQGAGASSFSLNNTTAGLDNYYDWATKPMASTTSFFPSTIGAGGSGNTTNNAGVTYVAYLFAHNAGGFGPTGTDNVISCGSFTGNPATINLGWEPQFLLWRPIGSANWSMIDSMRDFNSGGYKDLIPNSSGAEAGYADYVKANATGFTQTATSGDSIYMAIRRGPMKVPTDATKVFTPVLGRSTNPNYLSGFPVDLGISEYRVNGSNSTASRLQGSNIMSMASTAAESSDGSTNWNFMDGYYINGRTTDFVSWMFRRAPGFFDEVCYSGLPIDPGTIYHNLRVPPELIIVKRRDSTGFWAVYAAPLGVNTFATLNSSAAVSSPFGYWGGTTPTSTYFNITQSSNTFEAGGTFVAYLFATCPGVSKVGSFSYATGASTNVDCGFTNGARFVLLKQTDGADDWYVWDTARGINAGNDPFLTLNSSAAENSSFDGIDPYSPGFTIPAGGLGTGTFIFLAIA